MILAALSGPELTIGTIVAVIALTAGAVSAFLTLKGETREAIEEAADKRVEEAREQLTEMATVGREWRENFRELDETRRRETEKHEAELRELREQLDSTRSELAVALQARDLSGLEERLSKRFDSAAKNAEKQTLALDGILAALTSLVESANGTSVPA